MPINLSKAKDAIKDYRVAHTLLHQSNPPGGEISGMVVSSMHDALTNAMREETDKWGFAHEDDVFNYSDNEVLTDMGYSDRADFFSSVYDNDGNVVSGKEADHATWEARFK